VEAETCIVAEKNVKTDSLRCHVQWNGVCYVL